MSSTRRRRAAGGAWVSALRRLRRRRSVILGYHGVADCDMRLDLSRLQVAPAVFRRHLERLLEAGFEFQTMAAAADRLSEPGGPEPGIAVVTFDDGLRNNRTAALPIMRPLGIPGTVYVATDYIGGHSPWIAPGGDGEILGEHEIRALAGDAGWEIGAHTLSHPDMATLDYDRCRAEIDGSRRHLEEITGVPVRTFAYPFGSYGPAALAAVADAGLHAAVTTGSGRWERFELTRAMCSAGDPYGVVVLKMVDRYEPMMSLAPLRLTRATSRRLRGRLRAR